ncbi:hypothetical protein PIB30_081564 [Stylosanthes scabra]|uniref:Uncharacterized protein n=1 Tax=Stylosanthes scabra TaxID=79078 RepID=A0ABU6RS45_9FABA|nr:hypothetical protein [Stylosanthes scabra]
MAESSSSSPLVTQPPFLRAITTTMASGTVISAQPWSLGFAPPLLVFSEVVRINESAAELAGTHHWFSSKLRDLIESPMHAGTYCCCYRNGATIVAN